jgi:vacuolar-type H+-ATPase subunit H
MSTATAKPEPRKVLAIRATEEERRVLLLAAKREHRSLSSFMLRSALDAAQPTLASLSRHRGPRTPESIDAAITHAQEIMSKYRKSGHSYVDEFIAEKRAEAARERY